MGNDGGRETALKILYAIDAEGAYSNISLDRFLGRAAEEDGGMPVVARAFVTEMVYGCIKWKLRLDYIIQQFSTTKLGKMSPYVLNILRMGVYQLFFMERVPVSAAVNESVKLARKYGHKAVPGFVNGILRNIDRSRENIKYPDKKHDKLNYLSVMYSHPVWMVERWLSQHGEEWTVALMQANNDVPPFFVRVNTLKTSREALLATLADEGVEAQAGDAMCPEAVVLHNPSSIRRLQSFRDGLFQVQDVSSMLSCHLLDPKPGELVVDVCAAPGGKSTHMAQRMENRGHVMARDIHEHKLELIRDSAQRLGIGIIETAVQDASVTDEALVAKADRVLVDAPCTGMGIIRRKPDIKWSRKPEDITELAAMQAKILQTSSAYVRSGGVLVYSTCTINPEENGDIIRDFLAKNAEFTLDGDYDELYPHMNKTDGFFICKMRRCV